LSVPCLYLCFVVFIYGNPMPFLHLELTWVGGARLRASHPVVHLCGLLELDGGCARDTALPISPAPAVATNVHDTHKSLVTARGADHAFSPPESPPWLAASRSSIHGTRLLAGGGHRRGAPPLPPTGTHAPCTPADPTSGIVLGVSVGGTAPAAAPAPAPPATLQPASGADAAASPARRTLHSSTILKWNLMCRSSWLGSGMPLRRHTMYDSAMVRMSDARAG
jgi:hypothetical protein